VFLVSIIYCSSASCTDGKADKEVWQGLLDGNSLPGVAERMAKGEPVQWLRLRPLEVIEELPVEERTAAMDDFRLAEAFDRKLKEYESDTTNNDLSELSTRITVYAALGKGLRKSGGLVNLVLLDMVNRLALTRLCHYLVHHSEQYEEIAGLLKEVPLPKLEVSLFTSLLAEEAGISGATEALKGVSDGDLIDRMMELEGIVEPGATKEERNTQITARALSSQTLAMQGRIAPLVSQMQVTAVLADCGLRGLIEYLRQGGDIQQFPQKSSEFEQFMKDGMNVFDSETVNIYRQRGLDVRWYISRYVIQMYGGDLKNAGLRRVALKDWSKARYQGMKRILEQSRSVTPKPVEK
jgi:hypothetical protein